MQNSEKTSRLLQRTALGLLLFWLCLHFIWRMLDRTPLIGDPILYGIGSLNILRSIHLPWDQFISTLNDATETLFRPPGASLLLAPWVALFDADWRWVKAATVLWHGLMFWITYRLGKRFFSTETGLLAGVFLTCLPLIYAIEVDPEVYFLTLAPLALLCASHLEDEARGNWQWWLGLGVVTALGLLCKWVFTIYLIGPAMLLGVVLGRRFVKAKPAQQREMAGKFALMLTPVLVVAILWYWPNRETLLEAFRNISQSKEFTPFKEGWNWQALFHYPLRFVSQVTLFPALLTLVGIAIALLPDGWRKRMGMKVPSLEHRRGWRLLLSCVVGFWLYFAIRCENVPVKYMYPILPALALMAVSWVALIQFDPIKKTVTMGLLVYGLFCAVWLHFGPTERELPRGQIGSEQSARQWFLPASKPPHREQWPNEAIVEFLAQEDFPEEGNTRISILPDLYYFNWRTLKLDLRAKTPVETQALETRKGLEWLWLSQYILTSRGRVYGLEYDELMANPEARIALELTRFIDRAPPWFWEHYELVKTYTMPYNRQELQLYRLRKPHDEQSTAAWCDVWVTMYGEEPDTWRQIQALWRMQRNQKKAFFAGMTIKALEEKDRETSEWLKYVSWDGLFPYEQLQLGSWLLNNREKEKGIELLAQVPDASSLCRWKAYYILSDYLMAWQTNPERPEAVLALAQKSQGKTREFYNQLYPDIVDLFMQNRRPTGYQNAARKLLEAKDFVAAYGYARQAWGVGLNRINNTIWLHKARTALQQENLPLFDLPDYERTLLPAHDWFITPPERSFHLKAGESVTFPFLNMEEGVHSLHWKQTLASEEAKLQFTLDEQVFPEQTYIQEQKEGRFVFSSPAWKDRLRIKALSGEMELQEPELVKIQMDGPGIETWKMQRENGLLQIEVPVETDHRAWDYVMLWGTELEEKKGRIVYQMQEDVDKAKFVSHSFTLEKSHEDQVVLIHVPAQMKMLPFLTGLRVEIEDTGEEVRVGKIGFCREEYQEGMM